MKRFVEDICADRTYTGGRNRITSVSAALGGRYSSYLPRHLFMVWDDDVIIWIMDGMMIFDTWNSGKGWSVGPRTPCGRTGIMTRIPAFSSTRKLDIDVDKCILRVYEKEDISQIEVNVNDK